MHVAVVAPAAAAHESQSFRQRYGESDLFTFPSYGSGAFRISPSLLQWVRSNANNYDVIHVHGLLNPISSLAARACISSGHKVVIRPFGTLSRYTFSHRRRLLKKSYFALLDRHSIKRAHALHFTTDAERDEAGWHGVSFDERAHVVPPPCEISGALHHTALSNPLRAVYLSRINPVKNVELLLEAWAIVRRSLPGAELVIAGSGHPAYMETIRDRAEKLGVRGSVQFPGFLEGHAKSELLQSGRFFVLPSHHENFGMAVLEALSAGLPVIITREVQLAAFVQQNNLGIVVESRAQAVADAMLELFGNNELPERARSSGHALVSSTFSAEAVGASLRRMYDFAVAH